MHLPGPGRLPNRNAASGARRRRRSVGDPGECQGRVCAFEVAVCVRLLDHFRSLGRADVHELPGVFGGRAPECVNLDYVKNPALAGKIALERTTEDCMNARSIVARGCDNGGV